MRLIDADALEKAIYEWMPKDQSTWMDSTIPPIENLVVSIMMTIQEQPTIDAVPVRHGRWVDEPNCMYRCSVCGSHYPSIKGYQDYKFCPNCGARMDAERKDNG